MPGLNLTAGAQVRTGMSTVFGSVPSPQSATEAAFGPGYTTPGSPNVGQALAPNDPFGMAFWVGVAALGLLVFIRYSLPA